jgi:hypothetical protein
VVPPFSGTQATLLPRKKNFSQILSSGSGSDGFHGQYRFWTYRWQARKMAKDIIYGISLFDFVTSKLENSFKEVS